MSARPRIESRRRGDITARRCRKAVLALGRRHLVALVEQLAEYDGIGTALAYPSVRRLAADLGCDPGTVRRQTYELEAHGLLFVWRDRPRRDRTGTGRFTRDTNRYRLCDRRALRITRGLSDLEEPRYPQVAPSARGRALTTTSGTLGGVAPPWFDDPPGERQPVTVQLGRLAEVRATLQAAKAKA